MKKANVLKLLVLALCVTLLGAVAVFSASAEESELSVSIIAKNVSYDDVVKVMFAVDDSNAGGNEIEVLYYLEDPIANPEAKAYLGVEYDEGYTKNDVTYPAYFTAGFPAKAIGDKVYARAHIVGTDVYSDVMRYSVVEYLYERLYLDNATGDKKALYEDLLSYGASAQKVLCPDAETRISDYVLVGIQGGTLDGRYFQGIYVAGDKLYPTGAGVATWYANVVDVTTGEIDTTEVANAAEYTVEGFTMFTIATQGGEEPAPTPSYKPDLADTVGRILWNEAATVEEYKAAGALDFWMGSGAPLEIVDGAPYGEASKVLHMGTQSSGSQDQLFIRNTAAYANSTVAAFETDIMVSTAQSVNFEIRFMNKNLASADRSAYIFNLSVGSDGNGSISGSGLTTVTASEVEGNWIRLRAEFIDVSDAQFRVAIYYNGMLVAGTDAINKAKGADHAASAINQVLIAASTTSVGDAYLDNVLLSHVGPAFEPDMSDLASRETYEDGDALNLFSYNNWIGGTGNPLPNVDATPYGEASKVALFAKSASSYEELGFEQKSIPSGTKTYMFETDMMIENPSASFLLKCDLRGSAAGINFSLSVSGTTVYLNSSHSASSPISIVAPVGEWFRLTVECFTDGSGNNVVRFLINGNQVGTTYACTIAPNTVTRIRFYGDSGKSANIYFDNTKVEFKAE